MIMKWIEPEIAEYEHGKPPSIWISVVLFIVIYIGFFVVTVLQWKQGKPVISAGFFTRVLLVPLLLWGALCSALHFNYEDWNERVDMWNWLRRMIYADWRWWAQERVAILGRVALTPEKDVAVRMFGLEGSAPANAGKILPLVTEKGNSASRVQQVLEQLVTPFAPYMQDIVGRHTFSVVVQSEREEDLNDLRALLRKLAPRDFDFVKITRVPQALDMGLIEEWLSGNAMPDFSLVLAYQLHAAGVEPTCSEAAAALLFTPRTVITRSNGKLKPEAWLFRPVPAAMDTVFEKLRTLLAAQPTPNDRIKHLWLTHVPGQGKHAVVTAVKDTDLKLAVHDIDTAIGKPGPVSVLLAQALAAGMVQHGQGTQLLATPHKAGLVLNLVGTSLAPIPRVEQRLMKTVNICLTTFLVCIALLLLLLFIDAQAPSGCSIAVIVSLPLIVAGQLVLSFVRRSRVKDDFYRRLPW